MFQPEAFRDYMKSNGIDAWVSYDFRGSNPVFWHLLGRTRSTTRRAFLIAPVDGPPVLLMHAVDHDSFDCFDIRKVQFRSWGEMEERLRHLLAGSERVAMEYSPLGAIPTMSWVDGGTVDLVRSWGIEVVSSSDVFQVAASSWNDEAFRSHMRAVPIVDAIKDQAFSFISRHLREQKPITEYDVTRFIMSRFEEEGLETEDTPIVAVNAKSGDPHYEPNEHGSQVIGREDWILMDLWARFPGEHNVFADITWVAYAGTTVPAAQHRVFETVRRARDRGIALLQDAWRDRRSIAGYEVDDAVRNEIAGAGLADAFTHRTGHSIAPGSRLHGLGVNIDNFETRDTRLIRPRVGFSIEPGVYLPEFGVRLEVDVYVDPEKGPIVTTPAQNSIVLV